MGGFPQTGPKKFKHFNHSCQTHEIFRVGKYTKRSKFGGSKLGFIPLSNEATKILNFYTVVAKWIKFLEWVAEVESSRTSLASRTHFEVLGLEPSSPWKLACPWLKDSSIFWIVKILWSAWKIFLKTFFCGDRLKNFCEAFFFFFFEIAWKIFVKTFFFWRALALVSLVLGLGLEHSCPWPRECLFSERLSLASDFFCVLGLEPCVLDSTSDG